MDINFREIIQYDTDELRSANTLTQKITTAIIKGIIAPGSKLPSVNKIARSVGINRLTVLKSMEELEIEGWINKKQRVGIYVCENLPVAQPMLLEKENSGVSKLPDLAANSISIPRTNNSPIKFTDGLPDHRMFPHMEFARAYSVAFKDHNDRSSLQYSDVHGHLTLRNALSLYVYRTRNIKNKIDNILVTRGSTMGIYLAAKSICEKGDKVVMSKPGYNTAKEIFVNEGLELLEIDAGNTGLDIVSLKKVLRNNTIKLVYITPHHHYPTTFTMPAEIRMELLHLAEKYNFYLLEDDYDFEFQYDRRPILPVASIDQLYRVVYVGGFSKSISPSLRIGYIMANPSLIEEAGKWRKIIDRQGDSIQELAFAQLVNNGLVEKTVRRSLKLYRERRDYSYQLISENLASLIRSQWCEGGLAFWTKLLCPAGMVEKFVANALEKGVHFVPPRKFGTENSRFTRLGFASLNKVEMEEAIDILRTCL